MDTFAKLSQKYFAEYMYCSNFSQILMYVHQFDGRIERTKI